jgi:hypothetical protein
MDIRVICVITLASENIGKQLYKLMAVFNVKCVKLDHFNSIGEMSKKWLSHVKDLSRGAAVKELERE